MSESITLTKTQKVRVKWLEGLGCRLGVDFEVGAEGLFIYAADEYVAWQELASKECRAEIEELIEANGVGEVVEYDAETGPALTAALYDDLADSEMKLHRFGPISDDPHIGFGGEEPIVEELVAVQLAAQIAPLIEAMVVEPEVVMEPEAAREEPLFVITNTGATGVALSKRLRQEIAETVRELFHPDDMGAEVVQSCRKYYELLFGPEREGMRAAYACSQYAKAVVRSPNRQVQAGVELQVNTYWA